MIATSGEEDALSEPVCLPLFGISTALVSVRETAGRIPEIVPGVCGRDPRISSMAKRKGLSEVVGPTGSSTRPLLSDHMPEGRAAWDVCPDAGMTTVRKRVPALITPCTLNMVPAVEGGASVPEGCGLAEEPASLAGAEELRPTGSGWCG